MKIKLDHLGQFYSAASDEKNPGTFCVGVTLKEPLDSEKLQQAVNDLMKRLPHMNVRMHSGFFHYYNVAHEKPLMIEKENEHTEPCRHFEKGSHLLRVIYGKCNFTLEVLHSVCDGRSLAKVASALLIRYYELMEISVNKDGFIDCSDIVHAEEMDDSYARFADMRRAKLTKGEEAYMPKSEKTKAQIITQKFDLATLKAGAQELGVTITEYIMAHICNEFAKQREKDGVEKGITCNIPIDCRGFFPSRTLMSFVTHKIIKMPESANFAEMAQGIKKQFRGINLDYVQGKISELEKWIRFGRFIPLFIKKWIIKGVGNSSLEGCSTWFSNLGLINLPKEVQNKVDMLTFALGPEAEMPYQFACVTTGNTLTLMTTTTERDTTIIDRIGKALVGRGA